MTVQVQASTADGETLKKFAETVAKRLEWSKGSARGAVASCMVNALKALRGLTKVARPAGVKPVVEPVEGLRPSFWTEGRVKRPCLRIAGSRVRYVPQGERVLYPDGITNDAEKAWRVWRFVDELSPKRPVYLLATPSKASAVKAAKAIMRRRLMRYRGLAKRAVSLMIGRAYTGSRTPSDAFGARVEAVARGVVRKGETVRETPEGGVYTLTMQDMLRYATAALKNGRADVSLALQKAANKTISTINHAVKDGKAFFSDRLPTPFPEITRSRRG